MEPCFAPGHQKFGQAVEDFRRETKDLADFAGGTASPVRDDIGGHSGSSAPIPLIDMLNDPFPAVSAR